MGHKHGKKKATLELEECFANEFIVDYNGTAAIKRCGWNPKTATDKASTLIREPGVLERIRELLKEQTTRTGINADRIAHELAAVGFANLGDFVEWDNSSVTLKESSELSREQTAAVASIKRTPGPHGTTVEIKLHGKTPALEALQRQVGVKTSLDITGSMAHTPIGPGMGADATEAEIDAELAALLIEEKLLTPKKLK